MVGKLPELADKAMFVDVLMEGANPITPVTHGNLDTWIAANKLPFSALRDPDTSPGRAKAVLGEKEKTYVVDRATGRVLVATDVFSALEALQKLP